MMTAGPARVSERALAAGGLGWGWLDARTAAAGAGIVIACVAVGAGVSLGVPEDFNGKAALVGAFAACALAAFGPILALGRGAAREPIVYYPVIAFLDLAGSSLAWLEEPESRISLARQDVTKALLLVAAGYVALWVGWFATRGTRAARPRTGFSPSHLPSRRLTIALAVVGFISLVVLVATGSFGYVRDFDVGGPLGPWTEWVVASRAGLDIALAFAAFRAFGVSDRVSARPDLLVLVVLIILQFGAGLLHGSKAIYIVPRLLVVVFIYALFHDRMPAKWVLAFAIAIALAVPIVEQVRDLSSRPATERNAAKLVLSGVHETARDTGGSAASALDTLGKRTRQIENVAAVMRDTPSVFAHTRGSALPEAVAIALVPRVLWPEKPVLDAGRSFPQLYLKQPASSRSNTGPSHFGDLYRNFGLLGVILGMGAFGAAFAALGRLAERGGLRTLLIITFTLTVLTLAEDSLAVGIVTFARVMPPVFVAALLIPGYRSALPRTGN
jgi:hypothetical protein